MKGSVVNKSVMNAVCYEWVCFKNGLLWTGLLCTLSVMNMVCYERGLLWTGLLWTWSVMNMVCYERVWYEQVCNEPGLFWVVCYEQVYFKREP